MEEEHVKRYRAASFAIVAVWMGVLSVGLSTLMYFLLHGATETVEQARTFRLRLAWMCLVMLGGTLVLLLWSVMRYFRFRVGGRAEHAATPHVDAWAVAGRRFQLEDEDRPAAGDDEGPEAGRDAGESPEE